MSEWNLAIRGHLGEELASFLLGLFEIFFFLFSIFFPIIVTVSHGELYKS